MNNNFIFRQRLFSPVLVLGCLLSIPCVAAEAGKPEQQTKPLIAKEPQVGDSENEEKETEELIQTLKKSDSAADKRVGNLIQSSRNPFALTPFEQNYIIYSATDGLNKSKYQETNYDQQQLDSHEVKFQFSLMFPLATGVLGRNSGLMASYTQLSMWQALNSDISAPFRETNYEPQIYLGWLLDEELVGLNLRGIEVGFNHQSNGRSGELSRSWNRIFLNIMLERDNWRATFKPYFRVPEDTDDDDNPNFEDYLGNYKLELAYRYGSQVFTLKGRNSFKTGKGSVELGWSVPISESVRFYVQLYSGYGETLIDYDSRMQRIGMGFMLNDLL